VEPDQGRNEVKWHPGQEASWRPCVRNEPFRKQVYSIEESISDIVGPFRRRRSHSAPATAVIQRLGYCAPLAPPHYAPCRPCIAVSICCNSFCIILCSQR